MLREELRFSCPSEMLECVTHPGLVRGQHDGVTQFTARGAEQGAGEPVGDHGQRVIAPVSSRNRSMGIPTIRPSSGAPHQNT